MFPTCPSGVTGSRLAAKAVGGGGVGGFQPPPEYGHQYPKTHRSQSEVFFQLAHDFPRQWDRKFFCLGILSFEDCVWGHLHCDYINFQIQTKDMCLWSVREDMGLTIWTQVCFDLLECMVLHRWTCGLDVRDSSRHSEGAFVLCIDYKCWNTSRAHSV